jgi:hypothetical protein
MTQESFSGMPTQFNPWLEIWYRPRTTIRQLVKWYPKRGVYVLAGVAGYVQYLDSASDQSFGDNMDLVGILGLGLIVGPIGGIISLAISTFVIGFVARRMGGEADGDDTLTALAWGQAPAFISLAFWVLQILFFGADLFRMEIPLLQENPIFALLFIPLIAAGILVALGQLILTVLVLAEVNRFSIWRSLGSLLIAGVVVLIPLAGCYIAFL